MTMSLSRELSPEKMVNDFETGTYAPLLMETTLIVLPGLFGGFFPGEVDENC